MNKNAIKKFAIEARKKLIASVSDRAGMLGITAEGCSEPISKGIDFEVYKTVAGTEVTLGRTQCEQRRKLKEQIEARGFEAVVEEVAYTWFNRICAIRFMEVNDYLPTRVRVLSSEKEGKNEPDIVTQAPDVDLDFTDKEREYILDCKMNNKLDELFKMLFIKQCNKLSEILPELFEATEDYTEMLLNISYTNEDDIIHMLVNQETGIPEADFNVSTIGEDGQPTGQVEIIGWLYQYYNTELKDDTFAQLKKNVKISKERIPAATQLFTPDWIVRYMVENSVGRLWIEHLRAVDPAVNEKEVAERFGWKYYLPEAEQEADVNVKLAEIRTSYKDLKPEDITCIDPCMGSGHILVAMFDVLMDIYKSAGYSERDAAFEIVEHNIHGLDIDKRAYQLAYFAVMMKGRGYNRRFFSGKDGKKIRVKMYDFQDSNEINHQHLQYFGKSFSEKDKKAVLFEIDNLIRVFETARKYGSLICVEKYNWERLESYIEDLECDGQITLDNYGVEVTQNRLRTLVSIALCLANQYSVVVTNPPYMGNKGMDADISEFLKKDYKDEKSDLYAAFINRCLRLSKVDGFISMITQHSWMFLSSFEELRKKVLNYKMLSFLHLGSRAFDEIGGEVVQTVAFVISKNNVENNKLYCVKLTDITNAKDKEKTYLLHTANVLFSQMHFKRIPGNTYAYWISKEIISAFDRAKELSTYGKARQGLATGNNGRFMRNWYEVDIKTIGFNCTGYDSRFKWYPYNKGGEFRKWFGNFKYVVNWDNDGEEIKNYKDDKGKLKSRPQNIDYYFKRGITWTLLCSKNFGVRYVPEGYIFDVNGMTYFPNKNEDIFYLMGLMNSKIAFEFMSIINPTLAFQAGDVSKIPIFLSEKYKKEIDNLVKENIQIEYYDWAEQETYWDFKIDGLVQDRELGSLEKIVSKRMNDKISVRDKLLKNEMRINSIFEEIYDVSLNLCDEELDKEITMSSFSERTMIEDFISYAIGLLFGRYSLDTFGIGKFEPVIKNKVLVISEGASSDDDILDNFFKLVKQIFGDKYYEENLQYIAGVLGYSNKEEIRNYFDNEFYKYHIKKYDKTPIYWQFNSGKEGAFKALVYYFDVNRDTIGSTRTEIFHSIQNYYEQKLEMYRYEAEKKKTGQLIKIIEKTEKCILELRMYDELIGHFAVETIPINYDDGIEVNINKFQNFVIKKEGKKEVKADLFTAYK